MNLYMLASYTCIHLFICHFSILKLSYTVINDEYQGTNLLSTVHPG